MFTLSPKQDLILLAVKSNYPESSWTQISDFICKNYGQHIPSDVCSERYEKFLKHVEPLNINKLFPSQCSPHSNKIQHLGKIPQNFIFGYRQIKQKLDNGTSALSFASIVRYEKKIITKLLFPSKQLKNKLIFKQRKNKNLDDYKQQQPFVDHIYSQVKGRSSAEGILTEEIVNQKIEQILFEIVQKLNHSNYTVDRTKVQWTDPMEVIRLFQSFHLLDERRQILQIYHRDENLDEHNSKKVYNILSQVFMLYGSPSVKIEEGAYTESLDSFCVQTLGQCFSDKVKNSFDQIATDQLKQCYCHKSQNYQKLYMVEFKQAAKPMYLSFIQTSHIAQLEESQRSKQNVLACKSDKTWSINRGIDVRYFPGQQDMNKVGVKQIKTENIKLQEVKIECKNEESDFGSTIKRIGWRKRQPLSKQIGKVWIVIKD